jgi:hypothetical protein
LLVGNTETSSVANNGSIPLGAIVNSTGTDIGFSSPDTITIKAGTYFILVNCIVSVSSSVFSNNISKKNVGATLMLNGTAVATASTYVDSSDDPVTITLQHLATVASDSTLKVINSSGIMNDQQSTTVTVIKLS